MPVTPLEFEAIVQEVLRRTRKGGGIAHRLTKRLRRGAAPTACCAPTLVPSWEETTQPGVFGVQRVNIPEGVQGIPLSIAAWCVEPGATVTFYLSVGSGPGPVPVASNVQIQDAANPNEPPVLVFDIDAPEGTTISDDYHILVRNPCGCCGLWPGPVSVFVPT